MRKSDPWKLVWSNS